MGGGICKPVNHHAGVATTSPDSGPLSWAALKLKRSDAVRSRICVRFGSGQKPRASGGPAVHWFHNHAPARETRGGLS